MSAVSEIIISVLLLIGASFALLGSFGLWRLPDFYMRLHGPTKATTLGVGSILMAWTLYFAVQDRAISLEPVLITFFLFLTAPLSAHLMARAAIHTRVRAVERCDQILVLERGRVVERGAHAELMAQGGIYARIALEQSDQTPVLTKTLARELQEVRDV